MSANKYKPEYCALVVEHAKEGGTITTFGARIGAGRRTVQDWQKAHPEFEDACEDAKAYALWPLEQKHWQICMGKIEPKYGQLAGLQWQMGNRASDTWRTVQRTEHTGPDGGPIDYKATVDLANATDEQVAAIASLDIG